MSKARRKSTKRRKTTVTPKRRRRRNSLNDQSPAVQDQLHLTRLAELGRMAANVAHEINNPLMVVQGFAENLELMLDDAELPRDQFRIHILEIIKSCQRMSRIITKMNRMSRSQKIRLFVVDLAEVALNAVDFLKRQIAELDVQLTFEFERPIPIKCDFLQIEQIVINILHNALFALENSSSEKRSIRISFVESDRFHQIKIWNNGPPIPQEAQRKLSLPFYTTKEEGRGTGLGLAVSRTIMQTHQGELTFNSSEDLGTEFCLSFPRPPEHPWQQRERQSKGAVLIIDSQTNSRRTLEEKFRLLGFNVHACGDYAVGLETLARINFLCSVFVDIIPGQRDSLDYVAKLRQQLGAKCLIFPLSNYPSARDWRSELRNRGATESFEKPIHAENFAYILKLLDSSDSAAA